MSRKIEKKNWRSNVESCLETQRLLNDCISKDVNFSQLSKDNQDILIEATDKNFIVSYLKSWAGNKDNFSQKQLQVYNTDSKFWTENYDKVQGIHAQCNLFSFYECLENKFNLINLEGHFDSKI